jgi:hypothetical protein
MELCRVRQEADRQELRMRLGAKKIFHIEAFIAKVMT